MDQANLLNSQFHSVFSIRSPLNLAKLCHSKLLNGTASLISLLPESITCKYPSMPDIDISTAGVAKLLSNLNVSKSAGLESVRPIVSGYHTRDYYYFSNITGQWYCSFRLEKGPSMPALQKGDKTDPANYRPISLTCLLCKTMEHIVASNLCKHLNLNNILYDLSHGFREKRLCKTQLIQLVEDLARNLTSGKQSDLILLDFSKAFDEVNHLKLLYKLQVHGVQGKTLGWIESFLIGRTQCVVLDGDTSTELAVSSGVPQGSVLGPILFLLYINDLPDNIQSNVRLFSDDTAVYLAVQGQEDTDIIQNDINILQKWEKAWDMAFNPSKCQVVHISRSRKPIKNKYTMHGQVLDSIDHARYLGVDISSDLNFSHHVNRITANA